MRMETGEMEMQLRVAQLPCQLAGRSAITRGTPYVTWLVRLDMAAGTS